MKLKLMEMGYTEKQVLTFETMSAEQLVHIFDEASVVVHKVRDVNHKTNTFLDLIITRITIYFFCYSKKTKKTHPHC